MKSGPRGFTLIELMVALVVSSLLVGMILAIFSRMSIAYRGQQQIAGVQQVLAAARATIEFDAKQAGLGMAQGFRIGDGSLHQPVTVINSSTGPDLLALFYGDAGTQAAVTSPAAWPAALEVDSATGFAVDDVIVLSSADLTTMTGLTATEANIAKYSACTLQITAVVPGSPATLSLSTAAPWASANQAHCGFSPTTTSMIYKFVARAYRIDPARADVGALQQSPTGNLLGGAEVWSDLAYGFTDLQTALQVYDPGSFPADTADPDSDASRDWYSSDEQTTLTGTATPLTGNDGLLQISISLVARTDRDVEGIATATTPLLTDLANTDHNTIGDRPAISLPSTDPALLGERIYRYSTFQVDFRNLGVGR